MRCTDCNAFFESLFWKRDGEFTEAPACKECQSTNVAEEVNNNTTGPYINTREDWTKKIPEQSKEFFRHFKKQHSKYGNTIRDY